MLNSNISPRCPHNMVNFDPRAADIGSLGQPSKFQRVSRLGSVTARHCSSGRQQHFAALNRGRNLYSAGRPSRWALAHILVFVVSVMAPISLFAHDVSYRTSCSVYRRETDTGCQTDGNGNQAYSEYKHSLTFRVRAMLS